MLFVGYEKINGTRGRVTLIHHFPYELDQDVLGGGALVELVPEPETPAGKGSILYINPQTKELWYEYVDVPLPEDERIAKLEQENTELKKSNLDTQEAILELYEMIMGTPTT